MKVKELLTDKSKWIQGESAHDRYGCSVLATSNRAVSWCLGGAISKCYLNVDDAYNVENIITIAIKDDILDWNDDPKRIFADVKKLVTNLDI